MGCRYIFTKGNKNMKRSIVEKSFIPISATDLQIILNYSGLKLVNVRTGNRFHSTRNIKLFSPYMNKRNWDVVVYAYNHVVDPRYFNGRELETSEIYLNPKYIFLLDICRDLAEVTFEEYMNFLKFTDDLVPVNFSNRNSKGKSLNVISEFVIHLKEMSWFIPVYYLPIVARKICDENGNHKYFLSINYQTYIEEGYFHG